ncbi:ribonuclease H-like domain-containing protein [Tanacetum coccineum]|uniref:Ribonuclease H-like domain-containing protein n=1 Tax=Tanacetum coccineum TaxID=301880 RepID=A0ABQ5AFZ0_9ASTR
MTPPTTTSVFEDEYIFPDDAQVMLSDKAKLKGVERPARLVLTLKPLLNINPKDKGKRDADHELAVRWTQEQHEKYTVDERAKLLVKSGEDERLIQKMNKNVAGVHEEKVLEEPDSTKVEVNQEGNKESTRKRPGKRLKMKATKKSRMQKTDSDLEEEEHLKTFLKIVPNEEGIIDYENYGVHTLTLEDATEIHMLAKRKYPLTKETLERMMSLKLIAESTSESAYNLLSKELASPKQTALGKDISNPLIVDSLLKTIWLSMHHVITMKHWLFQSKWLLIYSMAGEFEFHDDNPPLPPPPVTPTQQAPHTLSTIKLPILKKGVSTEDANQKFLRSLPASWSQVSLIMRTKLGVDTLSFDDLYNNLRVFKLDIKGSTASSSSSQNVAFVSFKSTNSTNDVSTVYGVSTSSGHNSQKEGSSSYTDELKYSFFANQSSGPQLDHEDLEQVNEFDLEEIDLKWQVAMISMRLKKFYKKTRIRLQFDAKEPVGFDKTKEEPKALVNLDGDGVDWTGHAEDEQDNFALMAYSNSGLNTEVTSCSKECEESYAKIKKLYDEQREQLGVASIEIQAYTHALKKVEAQLSSDLEDSPMNDRFAKVKGMHAVSPPMTGIYMPYKFDFGIDESNVETPDSVSKPVVNEPTTGSKLKVWSNAPIIKEYESDSDDEYVIELLKEQEKPSFAFVNTDDLQKALKNKGIVDSGCSRHMTGNKSYLVEYQDYNGGLIAFGGSKGYIYGKGKIKTGKLDFKDVCFVKELQHFNLFSVSQMCDKKNKVLFTDTECLVLSPDFKLPGENQVLLRVPRQNNMYSFNLENIVPIGGLSCLIAKAIFDESNKWHRRLGHVNFKNVNKLVKGNLKFEEKSDEGFLVSMLLQKIKLRKLQVQKKLIIIQAAKILKLKTRIKKLEKKCKPSISIYRAWLKSVKRLSMKNRLGKKEPVSKQRRKSTKPGPNLDAFEDFDVDLAHGVSTAFNINTASRPEVSTATPMTPPTTTSVFEDEDIFLADALVMLSDKAKLKGVEIKEKKDAKRPARSFLTLKPLLKIDPKDKGKGVLEEEPKPVKVKSKDQVQARIDADHELAIRWIQEEQEKYTMDERAKLLAEYFENRKKYKHAQLNKKTLEEIQVLYIKEQERIADFVPIGSEEDERLIQKINKKVAGVHEEKVLEEPDNFDLEEEEHLKTFLKIVPDEEGKIDYEVLKKRFPIINWESKFYHLDRHGAECIYYKIFRSDESVDLVLWGDLRIMFDANTEDDLWQNQKRWNLKSWNFYENCGVHTLTLEDATEIHMLAKRKYPLIKETLERMMSLKLLAESASESAYNLLRHQELSSLKQTALELASPKQTTLALAIPEQTATGKEISNSFMAGSLQKTARPT